MQTHKTILFNFMINNYAKAINLMHCNTNAFTCLRLNHFLAFRNISKWKNSRAKHSALDKAWIGLQYSVKRYVILSNLFG